MSAYFLGIDGGGTKTLARLESTSGETLTLKSGASSLTQDLDGAVHNIVGLSRQILARKQLKPYHVHLACGVAGAGNPASAAQLELRLKEMGFLSVNVTSDARTSLLGAGAGTPIIMLAIGTGSVAMRLGRNGKIRQYGGWGLAVGDEGSGAAIGKSLVRALLWELDTRGEVTTSLCRQVMREVGETRSQILPWLQCAGSREYAALAPLVFSHYPSCSLARDIIAKTASEIDRLIDAASHGDHLPLTILGGLADKLSPHLHPDYQQRQIPPLGTALDGACMLARQSARVSSEEQFSSAD